jgi:hypothetical protein
MTPYHHALSSARRHGGQPEDYLPIHNWFDASKEFICDFRHRALRHHAQGIFECERVFGTTVVNSAGKQIPTRVIGEQHVREDCGRIPSLSDWLGRIRAEPWMYKNVKEDTSEQPATLVNQDAATLTQPGA